MANLVKKDNKTSQGTFLAFAEISQYVNYWADREGLELRNIRPGDPGIGHKSSPSKNEMQMGGVKFDLFVDGRPVTERTVAALCCSASLRDGQAFSMSQARQVVTDYLWERSRREWELAQAGVIVIDAETR
ncbi:hypothetical protein [Azospirillum sp. sgz301742]